MSTRTLDDIRRALYRDVKWVNTPLEEENILSESEEIDALLKMMCEQPWRHVRSAVMNAYLHGQLSWEGRSIVLRHLMSPCGLCIGYLEDALSLHESSGMDIQQPFLSALSDLQEVRLRARKGSSGVIAEFQGASYRLSFLDKDGERQTVMAQLPEWAEGRRLRVADRVLGWQDGEGRWLVLPELWEDITGAAPRKVERPPLSQPVESPRKLTPEQEKAWLLSTDEVS